MVTTKTDSNGWMLRLLSALFLLIAFTACSSTEDSIEDPTKPEVPINDDDWQTVSAKGGDIKKDDFTLTLPSGTFKTETKVAVTKVGKGQICGNNEVSEFYQVTAPVTTYKPITIKIKSERLDDDASIVLHSYGYVKSYNELVKTNDIMETTYSNGEYTATLPTLTNGNDTATISYSFGLVKAALSNVSTRAPKGGFAVAEGMVEDIGWKLYVDPAVDKVTGSWEVINNDYHKRLGGYIEECIRKILDLGFTLRTLGKPLRSIPFYYISDPDKYGYFKQSPVDDDFSYVGIGVEKLIESKNDPSQLKSTLIHELFHLFQADYDPREAWIKAGGFNKPKDLKNFAKLNFDQPVTIDNESIIHEMASVWVEQFMNNGELNANYLLTDVFGDVFSFDGLLGFGMELERWNKLLESYQQQGYTMGPWLHYIVKEIKELGKARKDHPVLELFQLFKKKWKSKTYNSYYILEEWINSYDPLFLSTVEIDDYYLKLWQGQVVKGFNISKLLENNNKLFLKNNTGLKKDDSKVSPFGCEVTKIQLIDYKDIKLEDKELVIKQNKPNVHTYVLLTDSKSNTAKFKYVQRNKVIFATEENDSITLSGKTLESLRSEDGTFKLQFFLVTTNKDNKMHSTTVNPSQVTFELRDVNKVSVEPEELEFPATGGTKEVKVNCGTYKYFGYKIEEKDQSWISAEKSDNDGQHVKFTVKPNTTAVKRETTVYCFVSNAENATDDQKVFMPVKIIQKASSQIVGVSLFASFGTFIDHIEQYMGRFGGNWSNDNNNTQISVKKDGGLQVTCSNGADDLSFEIDDLNKLKSKTARISNINGKGDGYGGWGISAEGSSENSYAEDERSITCMWDIGRVYSFHSFFQEPSIIDYNVVGYITITLSK